MIICPQTNLKQALILAEKLKISIANHPFPEINQCTCSFGVSSYQPKDDEKQLIKRADKALYQAKAQGRNRVVVVQSDGVDNNE